ncbi:hypothetical protein [Gordonia soli]|uniref:Uncharacterized protein n=1 Tax=Gordonia soli NBRC 108243 TaxID=1223545 RepID=M0QGW7_9ACTN|nr:hypothetical protein [Gordonia soli]GAC67551.1 hypothetical protein GS4_08_01360 [Gordonia soli NBRC 108243]
MRRSILAAAAAAVVTIAGAATIAVVGQTPSQAAPTPVASGSCGKFEGSGPVPDCSYQQSDRSVRVLVRNNGRFFIPVTCSLFQAGNSAPSARAFLKPDERGTLRVGNLRPGSQTLIVDCQSDVGVGREVSRRASFTVRVDRPERTSRPSLRRVEPAPRQRQSPSVTRTAVPTTKPSLPTRTRPGTPSTSDRETTSERPSTITTTTTPAA